MKRYVIGIILCLVGLYFLIRPSKPPLNVEYHYQGTTMGTIYRIRFVTPRLKPGELVEIKESYEMAIKKVDDEMSTYRRDSYVTLFNRHASTEPFPVPKSFIRLLQDAVRISEESDGAFDITVSPLVDLWGFGPPGRPERVPSADMVRRMKNLIGFNKLVIDEKRETISKSDPTLRIDLSAIAKGFAVDQVAVGLESKNINRYLIEIGGEVRCRGENLKDQYWQIGIEQPDTPVDEVQDIISLKDSSMATSGDYRNYYIENDHRISHTIDPRTGYPVTHNLASVTVIHQSCAIADAWSTTLNVLGPEAGYELAVKNNIAALFAIRIDDKNFEKLATPLFSQFSSGGGQP